MSDCDRFETTIQAYVAGELDDTGLGPLLAHCRGCRNCRQILELHRDLVDAGSRIPEPDEADFDALQARVLGRVPPRERPLRWSFPTGRFLRAAAGLAAGVLLFVAGLSAGRFLPGRPGANGNGGVTNRLIRTINAEAASNRGLADVEESRFTYSNASFRRLDDTRVALDFDVATHVQLVEPIESEMVREVLVHALLNPSNTGARLKAVSLAARVMDNKVREALIFAMRRDENLAVRLKALTILSDHLDDPPVEAAVLHTLSNDDSVQMRLLALDYLAAHSIDRERIREVIRESDQPGDEALKVRLAAYEKQL